MLASPKTNDSSPVTRGEPDQLIQGVFESPGGFVPAAIGRGKLLVFVFTALLALIGTGLGLSRHTTYTASATLQVGQVNPNSPGFYSYVTSAAALATDFSRAISAEPVLAEVQRKLKLAPSKAVARLSAEPIPQSPAFRVIATGPTESGAIQLANVAANAVLSYESQSNSANPEAESLLHEYRNASLELQHAAANLSHLEHLTRSRSATEAASARVLVPAKAEKDTAATKLAAIGAAYTAAVTSQAPRRGLVSLVAGATSASNDRRSKVELLGFVGLLAGIVIGCMVAILRERRRILPLAPTLEAQQSAEPV
jgi:capsular polysaccharide biosynthesis protein